MIFATANKHKLRELRELLPGLGLEGLPEGVELPPEEGDSFAAIALEKARAAHAATGKAGLSRALPESVAAVSLGIVGGELLLDLDYVEDSGAEVDLNVVMTGDERLVEVQATAERATFDRAELDRLLDLGAAGIATIRAAQEAALDAAA